MAKNILEEAVAEAQIVRKAAIEHAYRELEENLTPSIKEALAQKLSEEIDIDDDQIEEETIQEATTGCGFKEVKPAKKEIKEAEEDDSEEKAEEDDEAQPEEEAPEAEETPEEEPDGDEDGGEATGDHEEPDGDEPEEELADDTNVSDLTLGQLKDVIADLIATANLEPAPEGDLGVDMQAADVQGAGEEEAPEAEPDLAGGEEPAIGTEGEPEDEEGNADDNDEEIDLAEILKELESEEKDRKVVTHSQDKECPSCTEAKYNKMKKDLQEALSAVKTLKETLSEVNLLNAKLMYTTRMMSTRNLSESQKVRVIRALDEAKSPKEVKTIYSVLSESFKLKRADVLKEHKGIASKVAGRSTAPAGVVEVDETVRRFQQLAGIID